MTREEAKSILFDMLGDTTIIKPTEQNQAILTAIKALEQEPKEITLEDVKGYCKPRLLTIITNELYHELTHSKIKVLEQGPILDKIRAEIEQRCCITVGRENDPAITLHDVFQIIDKYKQSEESDEDNN